MPQAGHKPGHEQGDGGRYGITDPFSCLVLNGLGDLPGRFGHGNGIIDIVFKPGSQRDMPSAPVFCNRFGKIRAFKVFRQSDPQHFTKTADHIHVPGEIRINIDTVDKDADKDCRPIIHVIICKYDFHAVCCYIGTYCFL